MLTSTIMFLLTGISCVGLGCLLLFRKIGPNRWWGFRTPQTLSDPQSWYAINATIGKWLMAAGTCLGLAAAGLYLLHRFEANAYCWIRVTQVDGTVEYVFHTVPLDVAELRLFCLPLLALCGLVLVIQTFPTLFLRPNKVQEDRPCPTLAQRSALVAREYQPVCAGDKGVAA